MSDDIERYGFSNQITILCCTSCGEPVVIDKPLVVPIAEKFIICDECAEASPVRNSP